MGFEKADSAHESIQFTLLKYISETTLFDILYKRSKSIETAHFSVFWLGDWISLLKTENKLMFEMVKTNNACPLKTYIQR